MFISFSHLQQKKKNPSRSFTQMGSFYNERAIDNFVTGSTGCCRKSPHIHEDKVAGGFREMGHQNL
jgi:hypothetical protein